MSMEKATEIVLAQELFEQGLSKSAIARRLGRDRETIRLWLHSIEQHGQKAFLDKSAAACKVPRPSRQVDPLVKRWVWQIREREQDCCGQKIAYFLEREHSVKLSVPKIYEVLAEKYVLRSKWKKNHKRGPTPVATAVRQVVEMDTVDFGGLFAFTAVDIYSREADVLLRPTLTADNGAAFLHRCMRRRFNRFVQVVQTDGGSEFEAEFARQVWNYCQQHRIARPYKKNEQAHIESFNRTLRKECLGWGNYKPADEAHLFPMVEAFLERYHYHRPHLAFEPMRPPLQK
jgi:transposase-like protein